jgi:hypothetical protein
LTAFVILAASNLILTASGLIPTASNLILTASNLILTASNLIPTASNLILTASNLMPSAPNLILTASGPDFHEISVDQGQQLEWPVLNLIRFSSTFPNLGA